MQRSNCLRKIVVTGPESTGKTTLCEALSLKMNALLIPEYARSYVEKLDGPYTYQDLEMIARYQIQEETRCSESSGYDFLLMDTWLIVTKVWFEIVYGTSPDWLNEHIAGSTVDLFLVCSPDLPWIADPVRENGGEMRLKLFDRYCREIERYGFAYEIVEGFDEVRLKNALSQLKVHQLL